MNMKAVGLLLGLLSIDASASNLKATNKRRKDHRKKHSKPVSIDEHKLRQFVLSHHLKEGFEPHYQIIEAGDEKSFYLGGEVISFDVNELFPVSGSSTLFESTIRSPLKGEFSPETGARILVSQRNGKLLGATKVNYQTGRIDEIVEIQAGIYISFNTEDFDLNYLGQHRLQQSRHEEQRATSENVRNLGVHPVPLQDLSDQPASGLDVGPCRTHRSIRLAVKYDSTFCSDFGYNDDLAEAHIEHVVALANNYFDRHGLCKKIELCNIEGHCLMNHNDQFNKLFTHAEAMCGDETEGDPTFNDLANLFAKHISTGGNFPEGCDAVHLIFGSKDAASTTNSVVGCSFTGELCNPFASGVTYFGFTADKVQQSFILAQQVANNLNTGIITGADKSVVEPANVEYLVAHRNEINAFVSKKRKEDSTCTATTRTTNHNKKKSVKRENDSPAEVDLTFDVHDLDLAHFLKCWGKSKELCRADSLCIWKKDSNLCLEKQTNSFRN